MEIEPIRYELKKIKINKWKKNINRNLTHLGSAILANNEPSTQNIETAMVYEFNKKIYYGTVEGMSKGLPTKVHEPSKVVTDINWGIMKSEVITEVRE